MSYSLAFVPSALKDFKKQGHTAREALKKKLKERLDHPYVPKDQLKNHPQTYKIKLNAWGLRLIYEVDEANQTLTVLAVGKRNRMEVYRLLAKRQASSS